MCVWKSHLEPRKKLIFLPQNQPCIVTESKYVHNEIAKMVLLREVPPFPLTS